MLTGLETSVSSETTVGLLFYPPTFLVCETSMT